jgi:uracil-DNA glycosylase
MDTINKKIARRIKKSVHACKQCKDLDDTGALCIDQKEIGLDYIYPRKIPINILFVAESPPKPGNGFFYNPQNTNHKFRNKLFKLINESGLGSIDTLDAFTKRGFYLADSLNCRWNKSIKKYLSVKVFNNCSLYIAQQIELFKPKIIVAMGNKASISLSYPNVEEAIRNVKIPDDNIIRMSFILVASNETDAQRIEKLKSANYILLLQRQTRQRAST